MSATEELRKEHEMLRGVLESLEGELELAPVAPVALRVMCRSLIRMLNEHIRTEEDVLAPYARHLTPAIRHRLVGEHADEWLLLHELDAIFTVGLKLPTSVIVDRVAKVIGELRSHMAEEEGEVFPAVDRVEEGRGRQIGLPREPAPALAGAGGA